MHKHSCGAWSQVNFWRNKKDNILLWPSSWMECKTLAGPHGYTLSAKGEVHFLHSVWKHINGSLCVVGITSGCLVRTLLWYSGEGVEKDAESRMFSISTKTVLNISSDTVWAPNVVPRAVLTDDTSLSQDPPKWGALGGLKQYLICSAANCSQRAGSRALKASCNSLLPPSKLVPWSNKSWKGFPLWVMKCQSDMRNKSASILVRVQVNCTGGKAFVKNAPPLVHLTTHFDGHGAKAVHTSWVKGRSK